MRLQKETGVGRSSWPDKRGRCSDDDVRGVAGGMQKNGLIGERVKDRTRKDTEVGVTAREKSVMMPRFLAWQIGVC